MFPAASVAVPLKVVVLSGGTVTGRPGAANSSAEPVAAGASVQSAVAYSLTVEPGSAVPWISGVVLGSGEAGVEPVSVTDAGPVASLT